MAQLFFPKGRRLFSPPSRKKMSKNFFCQEVALEGWFPGRKLFVGWKLRVFFRFSGSEIFGQNLRNSFSIFFVCFFFHSLNNPDPSYWNTKNPPNDTPGASKLVVLTHHDIPSSLRVDVFFWGGSFLGVGFFWFLWDFFLQKTVCEMGPGRFCQVLLPALGKWWKTWGNIWDQHVSSDRLLYRGDYTTQLYRDCNRPLLTNQFNGMSTRFWRWLMCWITIGRRMIKRLQKGKDTLWFHNLCK